MRQLQEVIVGPDVEFFWVFEEGEDVGFDLADAGGGESVSQVGEEFVAGFVGSVELADSFAEVVEV